MSQDEAVKAIYRCTAVLSLLLAIAIQHLSILTRVQAEYHNPGISMYIVLAISLWSIVYLGVSVARAASISGSGFDD